VAERVEPGNAATPPGCPACATDLDATVAFYGANLTGHRAALLSYTQDGVISVFFQIPARRSSWASACSRPRWRRTTSGAFYVAGAAHTVFGTPDVSQNGVSVREFLTQR
jgi:hypothetical protein